MLPTLSTGHCRLRAFAHCLEYAAFRAATAPTLPAVRLTLYWENDTGFAKPFGSQDRHYTAGAGAALALRAPAIDTFLRTLPSFFNEFNGPDTRTALGIVGALTIFTPEDIGNSNAIPDDRPYAGWTYAGFFFQRAHPGTDPKHAQLYNLAPLLSPSSYAAYESLELDLGLVGPSSLAQNAQEMIHHAYDFIDPRGWNNQINDEPEFSLKYNRRWRSPTLLLTDFGLMADAIPELGITAGSLIDDVHAGATFRIGEYFPRDFGPGELSNPADFTSTSSDFTRPCSFYFFGRPCARLVAHNTLLQGDNFSSRDPVTVNPEPAVFSVQAGLVVRLFNCLELAYMTTWESPEFDRQHAWDSWSSLQLGFSWTF